MPKFHPLADAFPLLEGDEYEHFKQDIELNGLQFPVIMLDGLILDGRNRWRACQDLGIPHREKRFDGDDPAAYVWSANATRRHLSKSQLAIARATLVTATHGGDRKSEDFKSSSRALERPESTVAALGRAIYEEHNVKSVTIADAAAGIVSPGMVKRARTVLDRGAPAVVAAVRDGHLPLTRATVVARLPVAEQALIMAETPTERLSEAFPGETADRTVRKLQVVPEPVPAEKIGPGRGGKRAHFKMEDHIKHGFGRQMVSLFEFWSENAESIDDVDPELLGEFVAGLRESRTSTTRLLKLIQERV
jgi:hypothetical protein